MEFLTGEGHQPSLEVKHLPEGVESEDSGFASIAGSENLQNDKAADHEEGALIEAQRSFEDRAAAVRAQREQQNEKKRQDTYKRLLRLVSKSQVYSALFAKKFAAQQNELEESKNEGSSKEHADDTEEPSAKKAKLSPDVDVKKPEAGIEDKLDENKEKKTFAPLKYFNGDLRDYQKEGLQWLKALYENGMNGILADEMGLGKTIQVIAMIAHLLEKRQAGTYILTLATSLLNKHPLDISTDKAADPEEGALIEAQRSFEDRAAAARALREQQNEEKRQNTYKRLLHLVSKSKVYSELFAKKFAAQQNELEESKNEGSSKDHADDTEEPSAKKAKLSPNVDVKKFDAGIEDRLDENKEKKTFALLKYFNGDLRDYQEEGLQWLKALYENGMSGILADEMGLGKTIQAIAILAHLIEQKQSGPYLVLAPLSTTPNWLSEFERFTPDIPVVFFHGSEVERNLLKKKIKRPVSVDGFKTQPVVLTTYEVALRDKDFLKSQNWRYLIVDEGQRLKNSKTQLSQVMQEINCTHRLILTGTPLQNNLNELWSLLFFLMPDIFNDLAVFESWFNIEDFRNDEGTNRLLKQEEDKKVLQSIREILKPFMLRRLKVDVCLDIPPKKEVLVYAPMTKLQRDLYSALLNNDLDAATEETPEDLIVDDDFGRRPKRRCTYNNPYSSMNMSVNIHGTPGTPGTPATPRTPKLSATLGTAGTPGTPKSRRDTSRFSHIPITAENSEFLSKLNGTNRTILYKKVVNHPYLIHNPLAGDFPQGGNDLIRASGKLMVLDRMLEKLHERGHRVLLFSTLVIMLDLIKDYLQMKPWKYCRLDGNVNVAERKESIKLFNHDPQYFLFLISTRAGGVGLNLVGADTVILFDSDFNPQADIQAMARCHRIGQKKPVVIYRLCSKGSYDEIIISRAKAKRKLEMLVISKEIDEIKFNKEGILRLKKLLQASEHQAANSQDELFTEEELNKLLDRSDLVAEMQSAGKSVE
ncbi:lymphocyte-specific helicase-like [Fopius arisanus]|uniref:Lymphocyte-specific helicase-like n=1 Tax=Fopius arisanus TaxID=64838 RepID=A0A9R1T1X5_9HYME|nr:PREDICTED: lymphocyte-specific helicase-like [Fopius arisanus]